MKYFLNLSDENLSRIKEERGVKYILYLLYKNRFSINNMAWVPRVQLHLLNSIKLFILATKRCLYFFISWCSPVVFRLEILIIFNYRANI